MITACDSVSIVHQVRWSKGRSQYSQIMSCTMHHVHTNSLIRNKYCSSTCIINVDIDHTFQPTYLPLVSYGTRKTWLRIPLVIRATLDQKLRVRPQAFNPIYDCLSQLLARVACSLACCFGSGCSEVGGIITFWSIACYWKGGGPSEAIGKLVPQTQLGRQRWCETSQCSFAPYAVRTAQQMTARRGRP